jgi:hypothetical protein
MIHRVWTVRPDLNLENRISAASTDALNADTHIRQSLGKTPVVDSEVNVIANPLWR